MQACRERVAAKQARKKAGSERVPEIDKEFNKVKARRIASICGISKPPTYKDILTPDQQLVHEAALQDCRERVAAKQARKKAGSERVPEIYKEFVSDDTQ